MILRSIFFLLVFVNLVFFVWTWNGLDDTGSHREPQRLAQQLNADKLRIMHGPTESQETRLACRSINGLQTIAAGALEHAVSMAGGASKRLPQRAVHRLVLPELANKVEVDRKLAELRQLGVNGENVKTLADGRYEIVLASFDNEAAARAMLATLTQQGVQSMKWEIPKESPQQPKLLALEIQAPAMVLTSHLAEWVAPYPTVTVSECAP